MQSKATRLRCGYVEEETGKRCVRSAYGGASFCPRHRPVLDAKSVLERLFGIKS